MKVKLLLVIFVSTVIIHTSAFGQGALAPTTAPSASMKTLAQIEPRTPISSVPFSINSAGSYYLTTNVTVGSGSAIIINSGDVTLDLGGFTILSTNPVAGGYAIQLGGGLSNLRIRNGIIRSGVTNNGSGTYTGPGFNYGIATTGATMVNTLVSDVIVSGCQISGIRLGTFSSIGADDSDIVENCAVHSCGGTGISASTIRASIAIDCGGNAILGDQVSDCRGESSLGGGIVSTTVANSCGVSITSVGITAKNVMNSSGVSSNGVGISSYTAQNCISYSTNFAGLSTSIALNCWALSMNSDGLLATVSATDCYGQSIGGNSSGHGINGGRVIHCTGSAAGSGDGINAVVAEGSYGSAHTGDGLQASYGAVNCFGSASVASTGVGVRARTAAYCVGYKTGGTAINCTVANGCWAESGTNIITYKYNMP